MRVKCFRFMTLIVVAAMSLLSPLTYADRTALGNNALPQLENNDVAGLNARKTKNFVVGNWSASYLLDSVDGISLYEEIVYKFSDDGKFLAKSLVYNNLNKKKNTINGSIVNKSGSYKVGDINGDKFKMQLLVDGKDFSETVTLPTSIEKLPVGRNALNVPVSMRYIKVGDMKLNPVASF